MRTQNCIVGNAFDESNYRLALEPQEVNLIGEAFEDAWLQFTAGAPAGIDLYAEASIRQLIAVRIIRAAQSRQLDRDALVALALRGL